MKIELTAEQKMLQSEFKEFTDLEIEPYASLIDKEEYIPKDLINKLKSNGYLGSMIPKEFGGMGLDNVSIAILNEEIGRACSSVRSLLTVHGMVALAILRWGNEKQKRELLPKFASGEIIGAFALSEAEAGSDASSIQTEATSKDNMIILNGRKKWITMGQIANVYLVFSKYDGEPTAFLVKENASGFSRKPINGLIGLRGSMTAELFFENCEINSSSIIGRKGLGLSHVALNCLDYGRFTIASGCVGIAQSCLERSISYSYKRKQFGQELIENQLVQRMITGMVVDIEAARLLCYQAAFLKDTLDPESIMKTWIAKYFSSKMVNRVANDAVQIHGANGCSDSYPLERYMRDAKINEIIEGTTQLHEVLIGRNA
ncbi:acyl-CoA dehydrogenase family protein (plasmid) [Alkalihalophilus pseudofirmus]|uniref:acyl-CoA dehydrogenase family protein n=1 Tax=Alkalihalophilus pseudofirmus TaxID=79885 RepID=UPI00259B33C2|nr:acyl-CoA dehydrogenase family protein [Alkalihalophilus pseudofirmus]WEG19164.1 acyl-CoA dehydrogenase family protein [Alkalihalophilus pseudofirmus]